MEQTAAGAEEERTERASASGERREECMSVRPTDRPREREALQKKFTEREREREKELFLVDDLKSEWH